MTLAKGIPGFLLCLVLLGPIRGQNAQLDLPPTGKIYHGFYFNRPGTDDYDPSEHDVTAEDVARYEQAVGKRTAWVYFSDNWFESRNFPGPTCSWIRGLGKVPYIRLMLRSGVDQNRPEKIYTLERVLAGKFDPELRAWAREAKTFGWPVLIEWGTEPNGDWFGWSGKWNGGAKKGPAQYVATYRHIEDLMRSEGASNLKWVWHVNASDEPERKWNAFENYFPGENYCDWLALSAYGAITPRIAHDVRSFRDEIDQAYHRLTSLAPGKPVIVAEFGSDLQNRHFNARTWAGKALEDLFSNRWPRIVGFCWWNEGWQNDDRKNHDTDMIIVHDINLIRVFHEEFAKHADKIQELPLKQLRSTNDECRKNDEAQTRTN